MRNEVLLHIFDDGNVHVEITEGVKVTTKSIAVDTLVNCIKSSLRSTVIQSGLLPRNVVATAFSTDGSYRRVIVELASERATITYGNTEYENFPLPRMLFAFEVAQNGRVSGVEVAVCGQGKLTPETPLYYYPFSNVNGFNMCTGGNPLPKIESLSQLENLPDFIVSIPDNDDYYKEDHNSLNLGHRDLLEHLRDKDRQYYYDRILVPMKNQTLQNFL